MFVFKHYSLLINYSSKYICFSPVYSSEDYPRLMVTNHTIACVKQPTFCDASTGLPAKVSFRGETSGSVAKCRLFSQATCVQPSPNSVS